MAWVFQDFTQRKKLGDKAPWLVGWRDPDGKKRTKSVGAKSLAEKEARKVEGQLLLGTYHNESRLKWADFVAKYKQDIGAGMKPQTLRCTLNALTHFERLMKPGKVSTIKTATIDEFIAKRRVERGDKKGSTISLATINKELRHLKAVLRVAHEWEYLPKLPKVRMLKEPKKLPRYLNADHFAAIYDACQQARYPDDLNAPAADWWRALLTFAYMTGWRISEIMALRKDDVDWVAGTAKTRAEDNKGERDDVVPLQPIVLEHLKGVVGFGEMVFTWSQDLKQLWKNFHAIQRAAGIRLACDKSHEHTETCHVYGFHDLRRAFGTMNADRLTSDALQALMRHKSYQTTQRYIAVARQLNKAVDDLFVPDVLKRTSGA